MSEPQARVMVVTGGANGIGFGVAAMAARRGYALYLMDRDGAALDAAAARIREGGGVATPLQLDVTRSGDVDQAFGAVQEAEGRIDALVTGAGFSMDTSITEMSDETWHRVIDVALTGTFYCCRAAARLMKAQGDGRIVNISSRAHFGENNKSNYAAAKAGVIGLTKALAIELGPFGVAVNAVAPGIIDTPRVRALPQFDRMRDTALPRMPLGRIGTVEEAAEAILFLASPAASFITGEVLHVSGGRFG